MPKHVTDLDGLKDDLARLRHRLERAWDDRTIFPKTVRIETDPLSKGQCGVTSSYLAAYLIGQGYDVLYCEGNVDFPDRDTSITDHCWLKIVQNGDDLLVDITADQNGFAEALVIGKNNDLRRRGVVYRPLKERPLSAINHPNLLERLDVLNRKMDRS